MDQTLQNFFTLLDFSIHRQPLAAKLSEEPGLLSFLGQTNWDTFTKIAFNTHTFPLLYDMVAQCAEFCVIGSDLLKLWKDRTFYAMLNEMRKSSALHTLVQAAHARQLPLVFFKGPLLANLYPQPLQRISCDTDIWVPEGDKTSSMQLLEELGYQWNAAHSKEHVQVYVLPQPRNVIELHTQLWEDYTGKKITVLENLRLTAPENRVSTTACGLPLLTLRPLQHLIYQIFHIVKHFMLEGIGIRYLVDITLFTEKYRDEIDFSLFWQSMAQLGYTKFCRHLFAICVACLGMDATLLGDHRLDILPDTRTLLQEMLLEGPLVKKKANWQILGTMTPYFTGEKTVRSTRSGRMFDIIFLRPQDLTKEYAYAKKIPLLLPAAWVHRACRYFIGWFVNKKILYNVNKKLNMAEQRLSMLTRLGLADEE